MANHILMVFEGEKTEVQIFNSLKENYAKYFGSAIVCSVYGTDIYSLFGKIKKDPDLDLFSLLKQSPKNSSHLANISKNDVSEIYLFFDYDGHAPAACDSKIKEMLTIFNEETETGRLYISYPMVEALKHVKHHSAFKLLIAKAKERTVARGKEKITYKALVHQDGHDHYRDLKRLNAKKWDELVETHCRKMNYIVNDKFHMPTSHIRQIDIFTSQERKYIRPYNNIAVLSSFPIFIADYFGCDRVPRLST